MNLNADDRPWAPQDQPDYLCVLHGQQQPPRNRDHFLNLQLDLLNRLLLESNQGEKEDADRRLRDNLPLEERMNLPLDLFQNPRTSRLLLENVTDVLGPMYQWKVGFDQVQNLPQMPPEEARQEAESLSLESFLSRLL
jgi:hypothetical protein